MARPARPVAAKRLAVDVPMLLITATLLIFGLLMVYSASADFSVKEHGSAIFIFKRQAGYMGFGLLIALALAFIDYHIWRRLAVFAMGAAVFGLLAVLLFGEERHGAVRTLFNGSIQPSELAKVAVVIYLAVWLFSKREQLRDVSFGLIPLGMILGIIGALIYVQPDLSAVLTIMLLGGILFFLAGGDLKQIGVVLGLAVGAGYAVVKLGGLSGTGLKRVSDFLAGLADPFQASYHVQRSLEAIVSGGWLGVGIGNGNAKQTGLPVPHTDSIYAVISEEVGILGAALVVILFGLLLWRGLAIAQRAPDGLGRLLAAGLTIWLVMEAYVNMAVMAGLMPFAGNALPFISVGGSNLVVSLASIGIILNVSRLSVKYEQAEEKNFGEVVDLRWWDRRRRVSRAERGSSVQR